MNTSKPSDKVLRESYLKTLEQRYNLLERYREGEILTEREIQALWVLVSDLVNNQTKQYYKRKQPTGSYKIGRVREWYEVPETDGVSRFRYERHLDRMSLLLQFLYESPEKSVQLLLEAWRRRFQWFEMLREMEERGLGFSGKLKDGDYGGKPNNTYSIAQRTGRQGVRKYVEVRKTIRSWKRDNPDKEPTIKDIIGHWLKSQEEVSDGSYKSMVLTIVGYFDAVLMLDTISLDAIEDNKNKRNNHD